MASAISLEVSNVSTNGAHPKTSVTLTVRIIKSFKFRTERNLVLHDINLDTTTVGQLKDVARQGKMSSKFSCLNIQPNFVGQLFFPTLDGNLIVMLF